jgi:hypothetical protein
MSVLHKNTWHEIVGIKHTHQHLSGKTITPLQEWLSTHHTSFQPDMKFDFAVKLFDTRTKQHATTDTTLSASLTI